MGSNLTSINATLKEVYEGSTREQLFDETVLLKRVQRSNDGISNETNGKYVTFPVHVGRNGGLGSRNEAEVLPTAGAQQYDAARLSLKSGYLGIELTGHAIDMSDTNPKAFLKALDAEMERGRVDFQKDLNRQLYGDGTGAITTVKSVVTSTTIPVNDAKLFWPNADVVDIITAPSTVVASGRTVLSVDTTPGANTITISGANVTTVVGQLIVRAGSVNREMTGLAAIIANSGILYNINPSTTPEWKSEVNSNGGTARALSENLMIQLVDRVRRRGGKTTAIITDDGSYRSYWNLLAQLRGFVNSQDFTGGFKGLAFAAGNQEIPIVPDYDAPAGKMQFINEDDITYYRDEDIHWLDRDGSILKQKIDQATAGRYDVWQAHMVERHELGIGRRNTHALLSDLITS